MFQVGSILEGWSKATGVRRSQCKYVIKRERNKGSSGWRKEPQGSFKKMVEEWRKSERESTGRDVSLVRKMENMGMDSRERRKKRKRRKERERKREKEKKKKIFVFSGDAGRCYPSIAAVPQTEDRPPFSQGSIVDRVPSLRYFDLKKKVYLIHLYAGKYIYIYLGDFYNV